MFMALAPGEVFQHTHRYASVTTLHEGDVLLEMEGTQTQLAQGTPTPVDAHVAHTLINIGPIIARVECGHLDPPVVAGATG